MTVRLESLGPEGFGRWTTVAASIYGQAMSRSADVVVQRREILRGHLRNPGFVAAIAVPDRAENRPVPDRAENTAVPSPAVEAEPVGFGYGYRSAPGQWWHDVVARGLGRHEAKRLLTDSFELAELHVLPDHQGCGIGSSLLADVIARAGARHVLLSTPDSETPARALYRSRGFVDILSGFFFPGSPEAYAVMAHDRDHP